MSLSSGKTTDQSKQKPWGVNNTCRLSMLRKKAQIINKKNNNHIQNAITVDMLLLRKMVMAIFVKDEEIEYVWK